MVVDSSHQLQSCSASTSVTSALEVMTLSPMFSRRTLELTVMSWLSGWRVHLDQQSCSVRQARLLLGWNTVGDKLLPSRYLTSHLSELSLTIPPWVWAKSNIESWNTTPCTSPVSVVSQSKLVSGWGPENRRSAPRYWPCGSGKFVFVRLQSWKVLIISCDQSLSSVAWCIMCICADVDLSAYKRTLMYVANALHQQAAAAAAENTDQCMSLFPPFLICTKTLFYIFTSAKEIMFLPVFVCLFVCLFDC